MARLMAASRGLRALAASTAPLTLTSWNGLLRGQKEETAMSTLRLFINRRHAQKNESIEDGMYFLS